MRKLTGSRHRRAIRAGNPKRQCGQLGHWKRSAGTRPAAATPASTTRRPARTDSGSVHLHHAQGAQGARRQGDPRRRHARRSCPGRRSASSGRTAPASRACSRSWPGSTRPPTATRGSRRGATVGLLQQEPPLDETKTVRENVEEAVADLRGYARPVRRGLGRDGRAGRRLRLAARRAGRADGEDRARRTAGSSTAASSRRWTRCAARRATRPVTHLSGGERRRVALCKLLLEQPDLLLLDEPTNHLDAESVQWLEQHLAKYPGTILAVTHDRYFLDNVAEWILELDRGRAYPYEGNYSTYLEKKAERLEVAGQEGPEAAEAAARRAGLGAAERQGPAGQEQGPPAALRGDGRRGGEDPQARLRGDPDPARSAAGQRRGRGEATSTRASTASCSSRTCRSRCRAAASSASSVRTASARPPCSR